MPPGGPRPEDHGRAVEASRRVYRALMRAYPEDLRDRYGGEMVRCFGDLCRDGLRSGGPRGLAAVWARALPDLLFTVLKERSSMPARNAYLPVEPRTAARWGALCALVGGSLGVVYVVAFTLASGTTPDDPAWWGMRSTGIFFAATLLSLLGMFGLYGALVARSGRPGRLALAGAAFAVLSAASVSAIHALDVAMTVGWLRPPVDPGEASHWWGYAANQVLVLLGVGGCVVGLSLLGASAFGARLFGRLGALPFVVAALWPASMTMLMLLDLSGMFRVSWLGAPLPFLGAALSGWILLRTTPADGIVPAGGAQRRG